MWDNRLNKRNPKAPDFKCRDRRCDGVVWPDTHNAARPILARRSSQVNAPAGGVDVRDDASGTERAAPWRSGSAGARRIRARFARYLDVTEYVLAEVRPKYEAAGVPCTAAAVATITATLFLGPCRARGLRCQEGGR